MLWDHLRNRQLAGYKFSRQIPIGPYFADFLCREARLVIELDGDTHGETADYDSRRDEYCRSLGFEILRFSNADVMGNLEGVLSHIGATLTRLPTPNPSRLREGDE
ncbi:endonuclease domain-containing protein [Sphingobium terrigena]|nr:endonuclease domain-containing protein [Sphingobium terrigena]